jgi:hypothetical protein
MRTAASAADQQLSADARALLASLDAGVRPMELAARYPRIVNAIARQWRSPVQLDRYFDELLMDSRGNRQGFPLKIVMELSTLREHYAAQSTSARAGIGVWDGSLSIFERHR